MLIAGCALALTPWLAGAQGPVAPADTAPLPYALPGQWVLVSRHIANPVEGRLSGVYGDSMLVTTRRDGSVAIPAREIAAVYTRAKSGSRRRGALLGAAGGAVGGAAFALALSYGARLAANRSSLEDDETLSPRADRKALLLTSASVAVVGAAIGAAKAGRKRWSPARLEFRVSSVPR